MSLTKAQELDESTGDFYQIEAELARAPRSKPDGEEQEQPGSQIVDFYKGRSVFITGASGFIGKVLIEKLLRTCPQIKRIFVLIRPKRNKSPDERLAELLACPLFKGVRESLGASIGERVIVVEGDVTHQNLGLSGQNLLRLTKEVSVIFHSAATVKFDEPLKQSIGINIAGTKNMIEFCRRCAQLAGLVHVSTAYANCDRPEVDEHVYPLEMDPEKIMQMADWLDLETMQELKKRLLGARPNTYTYTKALAEWFLVRSARDLPVVIIRPSIVVASQEEPFKGWIDNFNGPTGVILGAGKGLVRIMYAEPECVADLVPVDKVINLMVALGWFAYLSKNQKHLMNDQHTSSAESFTESLLSGGPSSLAGSSSASTNGDNCGSALSLSASHNKCAERHFNEAAQLLKTAVGPSGREVARNLAGRKQRLPSSPSAASSLSCSLSSASTPSLSEEEEEEEEEEEDDEEEAGELEDQNDNYLDHDHLAQQHNNNKHHRRNHHNHISSHSHHHHRSHQDDGYGSRSDCANSISSSSDSNSLKRRHQRRHQSQAVAAAAATTMTIDTEAALDQSNKPLIRISGINDIDHSTNKQQKQQLVTLNNSGNQNQVNNGDLNGELECKLKEFRQRTRAHLLEKELPEELADIPVFHCTSGSENPISWYRVQLFIMTALALFPSASTYRYPSGAFTNNQLLHDFYRFTLHYLPAYLADTFSRLVGGKPMIVRIYQKFDQAANVLKAFTAKQWDFKYDNKLFLMEQLMNDEDKRLFDFDITSLDWEQFMRDYAIGVKKFLLKEPMSNLEQARKNLTFIYYRNLSLQVLFFSTAAYYMASSIGLFT